MKYVFQILFFFVATGLLAQENKNQEDVVYTIVEETAEYPGGVTAMTSFIQENLVYPEIAVKEKISGKCFVKFIVSSKGEIKNAEVLKGVENCPQCDAEALRVVNSMPNWKPAKMAGTDVNVYFNLPINFKLNNK